MDITPQLDTAVSHINSYGDGGFTVNNTRYEGSLVVHGERVQSWNGEISIESLMEVQWGAIDILLIGCGTQGAFIPPAIRQHFKSMGIVIDSMDTGAACRTFNILIGEQRRVAAALTAQ